MKKIVINLMVASGILGIFGCSVKNDPSSWSAEKTDKWFEKGDWHKSWVIMPDSSINRLELAKAYNKNPERWNKAFEFLSNNDLSKLEPKRYDLDGEHLYVSVSEYKTKDLEGAHYEAHRKYIDIQYVVNGSEEIRIAPLIHRDSTVQEYDVTKDAELFSSPEGKLHIASNSSFFIFFPSDGHMPGVKMDSIAVVRKIVVKLAVD